MPAKRRSASSCCMTRPVHLFDANRWIGSEAMRDLNSLSNEFLRTAGLVLLRGVASLKNGCPNGLWGHWPVSEIALPALKKMKHFFVLICAPGCASVSLERHR